jgi:methylmalonyl-CoA mutase
MVAPFDESYRTPDESSRRLARNTQLILKREALLSRVVDPLGGSYLVEVLTDAIAAKAWKLFQELESAGGFRKARAEGIVDSVLRQRASARELAVACRRVVLTGTNRFSNPSEAHPPAVEAVAKSIHPRAASALETVRFRTECHLKKPGRTIRILLAEIGDVKMRAARSQFASEFLACGGLSTQKQHFERVAEIAYADADLIVLCSSDSEYLALAAELFPLMRENNHRAKIAVAGNPQSADQLRALGVTEFIHMRSNAVEVLSAIQQQIGIED